MDVRRRYQSFACVFLLLLLFGPVLAPKVAYAADPVEKVTALNKKALDEYKKRDYDSARALLKEALEICNSSGLDTHPIKARTHIHLGIVSIVGFKDRDLGLKHFRKALEIQPDIKLTKTLSNRQLEEAFEEAMAAGGAAAGGGGAEPAGGGGEPAQQADEGGASGQANDGQAAEDDDGQPKRPVRKRPPPKKKKVASEDDDSGGGDDDDDGEGPKYRVYIAFALGTGAGIASGNGDLDPNMHQLKAAGFAPAQAGQITPEVGFFVTPAMMLSARLRIQYESGLTGKMDPGCSGGFCDPSPWAVAGFLRGSFFLGQGAFRIFLGPEIGGGYIRHAQAFSSDKMCGHTGALVSCVDGLSGGPFLIGGAVGFLYDFSNTIGVVVSLAADAGVPKFTFNFDINGGLALHF